MVVNVQTRLLAAAVTCAVLLLPGTAMSPAWSQETTAAPQATEPFPQIVLPRSALNERSFGGEKAVSILGSKIGAVAKFYGMSGETLRQKLLKDKTMRIDRTGRILFVEPAEPLPPGMTPPGAAERPGSRSLAPNNDLWNPTNAIAAGQYAPLGQTFNLHSRPGAKKTIFLNFVGARVENTAWNASDRVKLYDAPGFSFEGPLVFYNPAINYKDYQSFRTLFTDNELRRIQEIWQIVAEDYAAFDVDVTTELVSPDKLNKDGPSDDVFGITVLITDSRAGFRYTGVAGIAFMEYRLDRDGMIANVVGNPYYQPAIVNADAKGFTAHGVANTASHEAGHNFSLFHETTDTTPYYPGHGPLDSVEQPYWSAIMGPGHYWPFKQWSKGEFPGSTNREDDLDILGKRLGLRPDEAGDTLQTAAAFPTASISGVSSGKVIGIISSARDSDVYAFTAGPGSFVAVVAPPLRRPSADLELTLLSDTGAVLASDSPPTRQSAQLVFDLPKQGTYYLRVKGAGVPNGKWPGYTAYGSVGIYTLTARIGGKEAKLPVASFTARSWRNSPWTPFQFDASGSTDDGRIAAYFWHFGDADYYPRPVGPASDPPKIEKSYGGYGTYRVTLTVVDDEGLTSSVTNTVSVVDRGIPPVASFTATPATGAAPLFVNFDAASSRDDRQISSIQWDFGDGTTASGFRTQKIYRTAGKYNVTLRVVDDENLSSTATRTIDVTSTTNPPPPPPPPPGAGGNVSAQVNLRFIKMSATSNAATGTVFVRDASGRSLPNATVNIRWTGAFEAIRNIRSSSAGAPVLSSASRKPGCFTLTVTGITLAGYSYDASKPAIAQACPPK